MAIAHVQSAESHGSGGADPYTLAYGSDITAASLLIVGVAWDYSSATFVGISDTLGSTWTQVETELQDTGNQQALRVYYAYNSGAGANTISVDYSANATFRGMVIGEYSGAATATDPLDQTATVAAGTTATGTDGTATGNITPTVDNCLIVAIIGLNNGAPTIDAGTSYTERQDGASVQSGGVQLEDFTQTTAAAIPGRWTVGTAGFKFNARVMSFKEPGGPPPPEKQTSFYSRSRSTR